MTSRLANETQNREKQVLSSSYKSGGHELCKKQAWIYMVLD